MLESLALAITETTQPGFRNPDPGLKSAGARRLGDPLRAVVPYQRWITPPAKGNTMAPLTSSVAALFDEVSAVWKSNDGAAAAALFTDDGSLINPFGERADGRAALAAMYTDYFGGMLQGTTTSIELSRVRAMGSEFAVADAEQTIFAANGDVVLSLHVVNVLRRDGDDWRLLDSRPYEFSVPPQG